MRVLSVRCPVMIVACAAWVAIVTSVVLVPDGAADSPAWMRDRTARGPLSGSVAIDERWTHWSLDSSLPLALLLPWHARVPGDSLGIGQPQLGLAFSLAGVLRPERERPAGLRGTALLDRSVATHGSWLGVSTGALSEATDPVGPLRLSLGAWHTFAPIQAELSVTSSVVRQRDPSRWYEAVHEAIPSRPDTLAFRDTTLFRAVDHVSVWTTGQSALRWRFGRFELEGVSGVMLGDAVPMRVWAQGVLHVQLSRRVLLMASAGRRPESTLSFDVSAQPRSMIGLQLAPWASASWAQAGSVQARAVRWVAEPLSDDRVAIHVKCRDTRVAELAADFTDWHTVPLSPIGGGWWEFVAPASAGMHQVRLRLDHGPWVVPPGLPRAAGDVDAPTGVLVLP